MRKSSSKNTLRLKKGELMPVTPILSFFNINNYSSASETKLSTSGRLQNTGDMPERAILARKVNIISRYVDNYYFLKPIVNKYEQDVINEFLLQFPDETTHADEVKRMLSEYALKLSQEFKT